MVTSVSWSALEGFGRYLIVGVTSDAFDRERGKINVQQSLMGHEWKPCIATGIAIEIISIPREYGDRRLTTSSDWT